MRIKIIIEYKMLFFIVFCYVLVLEKKCLVCLGLFDEEDEVIVFFKCFYKFYFSCILFWF